MYARILVALDGSEDSDRALREALKVAQDSHAKLRVVHAVDVVPHGEVGPYFDQYRQSCLDAGQAVLDRAVALARDAGASVETALVETATIHPSSEILEEAKRWSADLIVLGTRGRSGLTRLLMGSVAEEIVRHAPVPTLLVHGAETHDHA